MNSPSKFNSFSPFSLVLAVAVCLASSRISSEAQSATATISGGSIGGGNFDYTVTLKNTSGFTLNSFWYGWTLSGNNLPSNPSSATNSLGWASDLDVNSIMWQNTTSASGLAPGSSATFSFVTTDTLSAITTFPSGQSVAYTSDTIQFDQGLANQSTQVFSPTVVTAPEPSALGLLTAGLPLLAVGYRRLARK
jgi:hypothetical protein